MLWLRRPADLLGCHAVGVSGLHGQDLLQAATLGQCDKHAGKTGIVGACKAEHAAQLCWVWAGQQAGAPTECTQWKGSAAVLSARQQAGCGAAHRLWRSLAGKDMAIEPSTIVSPS